MRLIDADQMLADEAEAFANAQARVDDTATWLVNDVVHKKFQMLVNDTPTVDAVQVVRCKDCKHFSPYEGEEHKGDCMELVGLESCVYEDDFCSYGERKDNHETD